MYYVSSSPSETSKEEYKTISDKLDKVNLDDTIRSLDEETETPHKPPSDVPDFDQENWNDTFQVSNYAMDIFNYLKSREVSIRWYLIVKLCFTLLYPAPQTNRIVSWTLNVKNVRK